jgi:hypothetical protein
MAINAKITATINQAPIRTKIVAASFNPQPNVSLTQIAGVSASGAVNGQTLVFNSATGQFEANTITAAVVAVNGGSF